MLNNSKDTAKSNFDKDYFLRIVAITLVFYLHVYLLGKYDLNFSLLVVDSISLIITPIIWIHDGILRIEIKANYLIYYIGIFCFSIVTHPSDLTSVINILYRNGVREEVFVRFFMLGIFLKYYYNDNETQKKIGSALVISNLFFMVMHNYDLIRLFSIFIFGMVFSFIYLQGGLLSAILAHTLHNVYTSRDQNICSILLLLPLVWEWKIATQMDSTK